MIRTEQNQLRDGKLMPSYLKPPDMSGDMSPATAGHPALMSQPLRIGGDMSGDMSPAKDRERT